MILLASGLSEELQPCEVFVLPDASTDTVSSPCTVDAEGMNTVKLFWFHRSRVRQGMGSSTFTLVCIVENRPLELDAFQYRLIHKYDTSVCMVCTVPQGLL